MIGIIASIAGTVSVGFQIARDIKNGEYPAVITLECIEVRVCSLYYAIL